MSIGRPCLISPGCACHGSSEYYNRLYHELTLAWNIPEVRLADITYVGLDLLDQRSLREFINDHGINSANLCYVLCQFEPSHREQLISTVLTAMHDPGLLIVTEPLGELTQPGCTVRVYDRTRSTPWELCTISDGHFRGSVSPLTHYEEFNAMPRR